MIAAAYPDRSDAEILRMVEHIAECLRASSPNSRMEEKWEQHYLAISECSALEQAIRARMAKADRNKNHPSSGLYGVLDFQCSGIPVIP